MECVLFKGCPSTWKTGTDVSPIEMTEALAAVSTEAVELPAPHRVYQHVVPGFQNLVWAVRGGHYLIITARVSGERIAAQVI